MSTSVKNLLSQTAIYGSSAILSKFINYLLTPYLTRIMSESVYGELSLFYAVIPFANVLLTMGMATAYFRWANVAQTIAEKKSLFTTLWGSVTIFAIIFLALSILFQDDITHVMGYGDNSWYWVATAILITIDNIAAIPLASLRQQGRAMRYTFINVSSVVINVIVCYSLYTYVPHSREVPAWVIVANVVASLWALLWLLPPSIKLLCREFSLTLFKKISSYSIPLMLAGLMGVGSEFIDRQMLRWLLPEDIAYQQIGIYSAVAKIASLMIIFRQIYTLGAEPFFLQQFKKSDDFKRLNAAGLKYYTITGIFVVLAIMFFSDLFSLIVGESFRVGMDIVPILLITNLLMGILVNLSFWYKIVDKTHYAIYVSVLGFATVVISSLLLIPEYGYYGAAYSHFIASAVMVVVSYVLNQKNYKVPYDLYSIFIYVAAAYGLYTMAQYVEQFGSIIQYSAKILLLLSFVLLVFRFEGIKIRR